MSRRRPPQTRQPAPIHPVPPPLPLGRRLVAEGVGTAFLLLAVVGSGIMASRLSPTDTGLQLFQNAAATGGALIALILALGPVSGAHFNPAVTLVARAFGSLTTAEAARYIGAQVAGGAAGVIIANVIFEEPAVTFSATSRSSPALWLSEVVATVGLLMVIYGIVRSGRTTVVAVAVGVWIGGAYFFTSSTTFANPAVTIARQLTDTFAGINPASVPAFLAAQLVGVGVGFALIKTLYPEEIR